MTPVIARNGATDLDERGVILNEVGRSLWESVTAEMKLGPLQKVLLVEACRLADRLDKLDGDLRGKNDEWLRVHRAEDETEFVVIVDRALAEARQHATALKGLVAELRQVGRAKPDTKPETGAPATAPAAAAKGASGVADLSARIAQRRTPPAG